MADKSGRLGKLAIATVDVAGIKDLSLKVGAKTLDVTDHDSGLYEEFLVGRKNVTISASGNYDEADAGFAACLTALFDGTIVAWRFRPDTAGGLLQYSASGMVTDLEVSAPNEGAQEFTIEIQLTGTVTKAAQ